MKRDLILYMLIGTVLTLISVGAPATLMVGATYYGLPLCWLTRIVVHPDIFPWKIMPVPMCIDIIIWTIITYIVVWYLRRSAT